VSLLFEEEFDLHEGRNRAVSKVVALYSNVKRQVSVLERFFNSCMLKEFLSFNNV